MKSGLWATCIQACSVPTPCLLTAHPVACDISDCRAGAQERERETAGSWPLQSAARQQEKALLAESSVGTTEGGERGEGTPGWSEGLHDFQ